MIVSTARAIDRQILLWPGALDPAGVRIAMSRNVCGDYFEQATAELTGAVRLKTDSTCDICPDLKWSRRREIYFESKSVGRSANAIVYTHRLAKDLEFCAEHDAEILYFFWRHSFQVYNASSYSELRQKLSESVVELVIVPIGIISLICHSRPEKLLNAMKLTPAGDRLGFGSNGYGVGWSFPVASVAALCDFQTTLIKPFPVYETTLRRVRVKAATAAALRFLKVTQ